MVSGGGRMIRNRCFAADLPHTVSDCVISDTRCNKGYDKEVLCENITYMFQYAVICVCLSDYLCQLLRYCMHTVPGVEDIVIILLCAV